MPEKLLPIEKILSMLVLAPGKIGTATEGLTLVQLHAPPNPGEWSANDVLAHLRACADVWGDCITVIIAEDRPTIKAVNPRTWIEKTDYREQEFWDSLKAYREQRERLYERLVDLDLQDWERTATVTGAGKPLTRSVHTYADSIAVHERAHLKQIERIAASFAAQR